MKTKKLKPIKLTEEQVEILYNNSECDEDDREEVPGFEGWTIDCDTDTGEFDSEKGSMIDYEICLYDKDGEFVGMATGGYYNAICGHQFEDLTFYPPEPETPESKFNDFLSEVADSNDSLKKKVTKVKKYLETLEA